MGDAQNDGPPATQYEILRDAGFEHLKYADDDDRRATQRLQRRNQQRQSNRPGAANRVADNGILESIECINFMCHTRLFVALGPLLNFIVGENGSGKSAVLTALTLCLGGKASSTNRGGNLKAFIKEGQHEARLIIKIKNEGEDAFQPEVYGSTITVERRFNMGNASHFKTISEGGQVIGTKKTDVTLITDYFALQVDNPLNILSQDMARQFLNQASPRQKYSFFLQGIQLQQLDTEYRVVEDYLTMSEDMMPALQTKVNDAAAAFHVAEKIYSSWKESKKLRERRILLGQKLAWAQVAEQERKVIDNEAKIADCDLHIAGHRATIEQKATELENFDQQIAKAEEEAADIQKESEAFQVNVDEAEQAWNDAKKDLQTMLNEERDAQSRLVNAQKSIKELEQNMHDEQQRLEDLNGDALTRTNAELQAAEVKKAELRKSSDEAGKRVPDLNNAIEKANQELNTVNKFINQKNEEIRATKFRLQEINRGQGSLYDAYERSMPQLVKMIDQEGSWQRKPVGPIGAHIRVLQPIWSPMLERTFGEMLNGFVVTNAPDQQRLRAMMKRLDIKNSPIIIGKSETPLDISRSEPDKNFDTILRILQIDDPLIQNQLIINQRIEKTILVKDQDEALNTMVPKPPQNVNACYHLFPGSNDVTVRLTVNPLGAPSSSPCQPPPSHQKPRLKSDSRQETTLHQEKLSRLELELKELVEQRAVQQQAKRLCQKELGEIKTIQQRNMQKIRETEAEIGNIQEALDSFDGADTRLNGYREELTKAQEEFAHYGSQYGQVGNSKKNQNRVCEDLYKELQKQRARKDDFDPKLKKAEGKIRRNQDLRQIVVQQKNEEHDELQMAENKKAECEARRVGLQRQVDDFTERATEASPRVHLAENETYELLEKMFESVTNTLQQGERKRGKTDREVQQEYNDAKEKKEKLEDELNHAKQCVGMLKKSLESRLIKWRHFQRWISSAVRASFMYLLSERDFRGKLVLDHENHTLDVQVEPDKTRKNAATRNTKTLSGGEKSFASICLLLAIWEAMSAPLRCLDEFDVFMDNVNRAISTNMLVSDCIPCCFHMHHRL